MSRITSYKWLAMDFKTLSNQLRFTSITEPWFPQVFFVILGVLLAYFLSQLILRLFQKVALHTESLWDDAIVDAAKLPIPIIILILGIVTTVKIVSKHYDYEILEYIAPVRTIGIVVCVSWFFIRLVRSFSLNLIDINKKQGTEVDFTTIDALSKLAKLVITIISMLVIFESVGFSISGILAAGGIGGLAIAFAAKDLLANFFGGLTIYLDRPFSIGDWIRSPDSEIEGTVEYISWRHTRVRAFNKNPIYVPNALFTTIVVENPSRMTNRRIKETVGIRYDDIKIMDAIVADVKDMLRNHSEIDTSQTLIVNFNAFGPSSLDFIIYTFTKTTDWTHYHEVKQDILLKTAEIISSHHAEIAFPTRTLHIGSLG
jgi:MscS family membrane protein